MLCSRSAPERSGRSGGSHGGACEVVTPTSVSMSSCAQRGPPPRRKHPDRCCRPTHSSRSPSPSARLPRAPSPTPASTIVPPSTADGTALCYRAVSERGRLQFDPPRVTRTRHQRGRLTSPETPRSPSRPLRSGEAEATRRERRLLGSRICGTLERTSVPTLMRRHAPNRALPAVTPVRNRRRPSEQGATVSSAIAFVVGSREDGRVRRKLSTCPLAAVLTSPLPRRRSSARGPGGRVPRRHHKHVNLPYRSCHPPKPLQAPGSRPVHTTRPIAIGIVTLGIPAAVGRDSLPEHCRHLAPLSPVSRLRQILCRTMSFTAL
jgi:hypothetical protein